jgi:hypothetical protein
MKLMELEVLEGLREAIDALFAAGPSAASDSDSIMACQVQLTRLEAFMTEATAAFGEGGQWAAEGAKTPEQWLAAVCLLPKPIARTRVVVGKVLDDLPLCAQAFREGQIGAAQARILCAQHKESTAEALVKDQAELIEQATSMGYEDFRRVCTYWSQKLEPSLSELTDFERREERYLYCGTDAVGSYDGFFGLDPVNGAIVVNEIHRLEEMMFKADWAEAKERLGREPSYTELSRTFVQRKADALVEMATRSRTAPADGIRPAPLFTVLVGYETLYGRICEIENGSIIAPGSLLPFMDSAYFERAIFALGKRIEVSVSSRLFTGATRRAIEIRDRRCQHPCVISRPNVARSTTSSSGPRAGTRRKRIRVVVNLTPKCQRSDQPPSTPAFPSISRVMARAYNGSLRTAGASLRGSAGPSTRSTSITTSRPIQGNVDPTTTAWSTTFGTGMWTRFSATTSIALHDDQSSSRSSHRFSKKQA